MFNNYNTRVFPKASNNIYNNYPNKYYDNNDERFGGFLLPFLTGAVVSAPIWFVAGNNKAQKQYYYQSQYQNQYPMYYPYQYNTNQPPYYFPYPSR